MPTEIRRLSFSEDDVQAALVNYALRSNMKMPRSGIENLRVHKEDGISVTLHFAPNEDGDARDVKFSEAHLAAAIILFCWKEEIPVPRDARKVLSHDKNTVSMTMQVHYGEQPKVMAEAAQETVEDARSEAAAAEATSRIERD